MMIFGGLLLENELLVELSSAGGERGGFVALELEAASSLVFAARRANTAASSDDPTAIIVGGVGGVVYCLELRCRPVCWSACCVEVSVVVLARPALLRGFMLDPLRPSETAPPL